MLDGNTPAECRAHAEHCLLMASAASRPVARLFWELARTWIKLAAAMERAPTPRKETPLRKIA